MSQIAGKSVLITGAASGIGKRMAQLVAKRGGKVIAWDLNVAGLEALVAELKGAGAEAWGYPCDVTQKEKVYQLAKTVQAEHGDVDILVNNAGVVSGKTFLELPDEKIERTMAVNTMALFWTAKAFLPAMIRRASGHVVTIASAAGLIGVSGLADYCASKFGAVGFDEALRVELRKVAPKVRTTLVCPYFIDTGMFDGVKSRFPFLLPILKEQKVAEKIIRAIEKDSRRLVMPPFVHTIGLVRLFPLGVLDSIASFLGVNQSMDQFHGREGAAGAGPKAKGDADAGDGRPQARA